MDSLVSYHDSIQRLFATRLPTSGVHIQNLVCSPNPPLVTELLIKNSSFAPDPPSEG